MNDALGDRMKVYEMAEAGRTLMPLLPAMARLDGRCFSGFTRSLKRPYDHRLSDLMMDTTEFLVQETNAVCGYTQSDEITLAWHAENFDSQIFFAGRIQKMASVLAAMCSVHFNRLLPKLIPEKAECAPVFDCRVWNVPNLEEAANTFLWRELDAAKNSVSMAARHYYSHKQLDGQGKADQMEMLFQKGVNWNDYPAFFKRGTFIRRTVTSRRFTADEIGKLPLKHEARTNPDLMVERTDYTRLELPPLNKIKNRVGVLFRGEVAQPSPPPNVEEK